MKNEPYYSTTLPSEARIDLKAVAVKWQVLGWLFLTAFLFFYKVFVVGETFGNNLDFLILTVLNIGVFYFNVHILLPFAFKGKGRALYRIIFYTTLEMIALLTLLIAISIAVGSLEVSLQGSFPQISILNFFTISFPIYCGLIVSLWYYGLLWGLTQMRLKERKKLLIYNLEKQMNVLELNYIKAKLPTHFLSNTFTLMRGKMRNKPEIGLQCVNIVSGILQFYTHRTLDGLISVEDEMQQLKRYMELQEIRLEQKVFLDIDVQVDASSCKILPMIILSIAENMYKYALLLDEDKPAQLSITLEEEFLRIWASNWIKPDKNILFSSGFGHEELQVRLAHFYPAGYSFKTNYCKDIYEIELRIFEIMSSVIQEKSTLVSH